MNQLLTCKAFPGDSMIMLANETTRDSGRRAFFFVDWKYKLTYKHWISSFHGYPYMQCNVYTLCV